MMEFMIQDARSKMQDPGCRIQGAKSTEQMVRGQTTISDCEMRILNLKVNSQNSEFRGQIKNHFS